MLQPSPSSSSLEDIVTNDLRNLHLGVADLSRHNEYNLTGNGTFNQHYGAVYNHTTNHISCRGTLPKLPLFSRCPAPSPKYTPREAIESHIYSYFFSGCPGMKRYVLHGPGGTGKTEIGLAFADKYCHSQELENKLLPEALWVDATTDSTIKDSFRDIGLSMDIGPKVEDVLLWLANRNGPDANWIVVFNNADDPNLDLDKYFAKCSHGNILVTTRNYHACHYGVGPGSNYGVSETTADEALMLFRKHARLFDDADHSSIETAKVLVEEVGRFALAVTQAGAFISESQCGLSQYRILYRDQRQELLCQYGQMQTSDYHQYRSLHATWTISHTGLSDPAKELIHIFGCVHNEGIKEDMFLKPCSGGIGGLESCYSALFTERERGGLARLKKLCELLSTNGKWDSMKFRQLIKELQLYSLVIFDPERGTCSLHPLVHNWARHVCNAEEHAALLQCTVLLLGSSLVQFKTAEDLVFCRTLVAHVDQVFEGINTKTSACGDRIGRAYSEAGRWHIAVIHEELFGELCTKVLGEKHPDTLTSIDDLVSTYSALGRYNDAEKLRLRVVEARKGVWGIEHPDTLVSMHNLALAYTDLGQFKDAEKLQLEVVEAEGGGFGR